MSNAKVKKYVLITGGFLGVSMLIISGLVMYIISDGFRDYKSFCSNYIPLIDEYYRKNNQYPNTLDSFEKPRYYPRYKPSECGYSRTEAGYMFYAPSGFGVVMYFSDNKKWIYD